MSPVAPEAKAGDGTKQTLIGLVMLGGIALGGAGFIQSDGTNWAMVAGGVAVLIVGFVLMMMVYPNGAPDTSPERSELKRATANWTAALVIRSYKNDNGGRQKASKEASYLMQHGYSLADQSSAGSHVNVGRTASAAVLTGGVSLLFGASRSKGTIDATFVRQ